MSAATKRFLVSFELIGHYCTDFVARSLFRRAALAGIALGVTVAAAGCQSEPDFFQPLDAGGGSDGTTVHDASGPLTPVFAADLEVIRFQEFSRGALGQEVLVLSNANTDPDAAPLVIEAVEADGIPLVAGLDWCVGSEPCSSLQVEFCVINGEPGSLNCAVEDFVPARRLALGPGEQLDVLLTYSFESQTRVEGTLRFLTNAPPRDASDDREGVRTIPVSATLLPATILVRPSSLRFGRVNLGEGPSCLGLTISKDGVPPVSVTGWSVLGGDGLFTLAVDSAFDRVAPSGVLTFETDEQQELDVCFSPLDSSPASAVLLVEVGDDRLFVDLAGNGPEACIEVSPEEGHNFGSVPVGGRADASLEINNCADPSNGESLLVDLVEIVGAGGAADSAGPIVVIGQDSGIAIAPGENFAVRVGCEPTETGSFANFVRVYSNDDLNPTVDIPLTCVSTGD